MKRRVRSFWPAIIWVVMLILLPLSLFFAHVDIPNLVAYPVAVLSPTGAALWRFL